MPADVAPVLHDGEEGLRLHTLLRMIAGRYDLEEQIGAGGTAVVWRAVDTVLGRKVAVKRLLPALASDPAAVERFRREGRAAASLNHPNILSVYDAGEDEEGPYLVSELIVGETLAQRLNRTGPLPPSEVADLLRQVAAGLDHAHQAGLVHRDIKPANLILEADGRVRIADFGIARSVEDVTTVTASGDVVGTVAYMAPELIDGQPASPASDIYSLGVVAYESLSGRRPFAGDTLAGTLDAIRSQDPPALTGVPAEMTAPVAAAMAKDPGERPATAGEFAATLAGTSTLLLPLPGAETEPRPAIAPDEPTVVLRPERPVQQETRSASGWALPVAALVGLALLVPFALSDDQATAPTTTAVTTTTVPPTTTTTTPPTTTTTPREAVDDSEVAVIAGQIQDLLAGLEPPEFKPNEVRELSGLIDEVVQLWEEGDLEKAAEKLDTAEDKIAKLAEGRGQEREETGRLHELLGRLREAIGED